jgi:hypothetical protein
LRESLTRLANTNQAAKNMILGIIDCQKEPKVQQKHTLKVSDVYQHSSNTNTARISANTRQQDTYREVK